MRKFLPALLVAVLPFALSADTVVEEIIVRVNNSIITRSEFLHEKDRLKQEAQQQDPANADKIYSQHERDVLRDLIDEQLLLEKGKDLDISADTDIVKRLDQMRKDFNLESMEDLEKAATAQGVSFEDFKLNLKNQIIKEKVIGREVLSHMNISPDELHKFYEEHKAELQRPEQVRLSEILVATPTGDAANDPAQIDAAKAKADALLEQIHKGTSFEDVAKKGSNGPTASQGGDLGYFKRGTLAKELEDKTFAMKPGDVSEVIRTKQGFVLLKVAEHQQEGIPPYTEVEARVQDAIYMQRLEPAKRAYLQKLREEAYIDIKPGYIDTGASPNQTKPVETNTKEANAKVLKKKKKFGII